MKRREILMTSLDELALAMNKVLSLHYPPPKDSLARLNIYINASMNELQINYRIKITSFNKTQGNSIVYIYHIK